MDNVVEMFSLTKRYDENATVIDLYSGLGRRLLVFSAVLVRLLF
ncbi:hypothetical protein Mtc_0718 [Methanocella conradii HZ254]|uniref:Uncharacterized protein n=1 Tax=Methanocella conradii (strain DSM 24694 / JCM 17849 / CGMCC 1.5162 / HZ254) TaxID=1041930 RepID=H8I8K6_METCZ|nr:hypothetical protein [Methanocella conradii]AFC99482.1 hypothetical protein Mtc_0718 [Methanocella conradii HZ254]